MAEENETPKISDEDEKVNFLNELTKKLEEIKAAEERVKNVVERAEELAARNILAGKSDAGVQPPQLKDESPKEYLDRVFYHKKK